ncbi:hypothetical protein O0L34_g944 [Tuta absoluta]|nr:hypothetical protein O0L34_g944 [Tuta absoluta]
MEKDLDPDVIKATQSSLGKYVKRPPLTEKLLKKPPFRFLHDIVTTVMKTTGFFDGLFGEDELNSENVKDRDNKIAFLNKVISVLSTTTGRNLAAKPSKIVAGQEPENTNELLQCIAFALDNKLSSNDAVKKFKESGKIKSDKTEKNKEPVKAVKKANDGNKLTSKSSEKLTSKKKDAAEKTLTSRNEKEKNSNAKSKQKEAVATKKESPPKKTSTQQPKTLTKRNSVEKISQNKNNENIKTKNIEDVDPVVENNANVKEDNSKEFLNDHNEDQENQSFEKQDIPNINVPFQQMSPRPDLEDQGKLNSSSYTIVEIDLNSSLSSQDLMEVNQPAENQPLLAKDSSIDVEIPQNQDHPNSEPVMKNESDKSFQEDIKKLSKSSSSRQSSLNKDIESEGYQLDNNTPKDIAQNLMRPKSVRPSSSRPGAPRLREKHDNMTVTGTENLLVGKVNIIAENAPNEEEEDSSIILVDQGAEAPALSKDRSELHLSSNQQHGALVQQILDSQKEYSQTAGKTEIEWQFGAQKVREAVNQEVEQLRYNIQALSRVANPLGKVLDHVQEDVEVMRQELQQWTKTYDEASKELLKQKTANEDSLFPLHAKLKQLDSDISEKHDKMNDLKIIIHKNAMRIEKLLAGGDVQ